VEAAPVHTGNELDPVYELNQSEVNVGGSDVFAGSSDLFAGVRNDDAPVVDICIIFSDHGEKIPAGYECIVRTPLGYKGDCNSGWFGGEAVYICFKRVYDAKLSSSETMIIDIKLIIFNKEKTPEGYELIKTSRTGVLPGNINYGFTGNSIYLAVKRAPYEPSIRERYHSLIPIVDICMINLTKREPVPWGYEMLQHSTNEGNWTGNKMHLCVKRAEGCGMLDTPLTAALTDRVPRVDHVDFPLPEEIALFTTPNGIDLMEREKTNVPLPQYFSFVLTVEDGSHVHASCLTFYEAIDNDTTVQYLETGYDRYLQIMSKSTTDLRIQRQLEASLLKESDDSLYYIYAPVQLCILSRFPFYRELKQFLMLLYQISISGTSIPIEKYISQMIFELPVPVPGAAGFLLRFRSDSLNGVRFSLPPDNGLPMCSVNYEVVFRCLGFDKFIQVFSLMLLGKRIILHSKSVSVLNQVAESLRSLMFPYDWQHIYIPLCPSSLLQLIEAPVPYLIGIRSNLLPHCPAVPDVWQVDLDEGKLYYTDVLMNVSKETVASLARVPPGGRSIDPNAVVRVLGTSKTPLPLHLSQAFKKRLESIVASLAPSLVSHVGKGVTLVYAHQDPDMAYSLTPLEASGEASLMALQYAIRDAAVKVTGMLMCHYTDFLLAPKFDIHHQWRIQLESTNIEDIFDIKGFLAIQPQANKAFVTELVSTLHFSKFIDDRTFSSALGYKFLFFDALVEELKIHEIPTVTEPSLKSPASSPNVLSSPDSASSSKRKSSGFGFGFKKPVSSHKIPLNEEFSLGQLVIDKVLARYVPRRRSKSKSSQETIIDAGGLGGATSVASSKSYVYDSFPQLKTQLLNSIVPISDDNESMIESPQISRARSCSNPSTSLTSLARSLSPRLSKHSDSISHWNSLDSSKLVEKVTLAHHSSSHTLIRRSDSNISRFNLAGVRVHDEKQFSILELQNLKSTKDERWPLRCLEELLGGWLCLVPALVCSSRHPVRHLAIVLSQVTKLYRDHGDILDQAAIRSLLASISHGGAAFVRDGHRLYETLKRRNSKPNASTYGFLTHAISVGSQEHYSWDRKRIWKRLKTFFTVYAYFRGAGKGRLEKAANETRIDNDRKEVVIWSLNICPCCKSKLADEFIISGWEADDEQLAHKCPFCQFQMVPRLSYRDGNDFRQVEYMNPLVFRKQMEALVMDSETAQYTITHGKLLETNPALYVNLLWFCKRLNLPNLLPRGGSEKRKIYTRCSWDGEAFLKCPSAFRNEESSQLKRIPPPERPRGKTIIRRYTKPEEDLDAWKFVATGLPVAAPIARDTLWGNRDVATFLLNADKAEVERNAACYVGADSQPLQVIATIHFYLKKRFLQNAVFLFLSARIASHKDAPDETCAEYGDGFFVIKGWEVFSNSMFQELLALTKLLPQVYDRFFQLESHLRFSMNQTHSRNATLASYLRIQDFPPDDSTMIFIDIFPQLFP